MSRAPLRLHGPAAASAPARRPSPYAHRTHPVGDSGPRYRDMPAGGVVGVLGHHRRNRQQGRRGDRHPSPTHGGSKPGSAPTAHAPNQPSRLVHTGVRGAVRPRAPPSRGTAARPARAPHARRRMVRRRDEVLRDEVAQRAMKLSRFAHLLRAHLAGRRVCATVRRVSKDTSLSGAPGADPEPSWCSVETTDGPATGAFVMSAGDPHRYGDVSICPADDRGAPSHIASGSPSLSSSSRTRSDRPTCRQSSRRRTGIPAGRQPPRVEQLRHGHQRGDRDCTRRRSPLWCWAIPRPHHNQIDWPCLTHRYARRFFTGGGQSRGHPLRDEAGGGLRCARRRPAQ